MLFWAKQQSLKKNAKKNTDSQDKVLSVVVEHLPKATHKTQKWKEIVKIKRIYKCNKVACVQLLLI